MQSTTFELMYQLEERHWWFSGRRSLVKRLLKWYIPDSTNLSILDAGCGTGLLDEELRRENYKVIGIDSSPEAVHFSRKHGNDAVESSLESCPLPAQFFDIILLLDVIEHVPNENVVLKEADRLLKLGGIIIIFVPAFKLWWSRQDEFLGHYRRYTIKDLETLFEMKRWSVLNSGYFNFVLSLPILLVRKLSDFLELPTKDEISQASRLNFIFSKIFCLELKLVPWLKFPFGVSAYCVVKKNN